MAKRLIIFLAFLVLAGAGCQKTPPPAPNALGVEQPSNETNGISIGQRAPNFTLNDFQGSPVSLADFRGTPVFIDFWAAWCPYCVQELPIIESAHRTHGKNLVVLGIHRSNTEDVATGKRFAEDKGVTYPLLEDADGEVYRAYTGGRQFMPVGIFIDSEGKISDIIYGPKSAAQIEQGLERVQTL